MHITQTLRNIRILSKVNVVDNSKIGQEVKLAGKKVKCIHVYHKSNYDHGSTGDKILVTIMGQMKKAYITGCVADQKAFVPRFDTNNVVLVDNEDKPLGTRITTPIPHILRKSGASTARIMAIATRFV